MRPERLLTRWMLKVIDVLLVPIEGEHVCIGPANLLEALLISASGAHFDLKALSFVWAVDFLVSRGIQNFLSFLVNSVRSWLFDFVLVIGLERSDVYNDKGW